MSYDYSENILVQESAGHLLERELGWQVAFAYNTEKLGKDGTFGRTSYREILVTRYFREALKRLNPWLTPAQLDEAQKKMEQHLSTASLIQINEEKIRPYPGRYPRYHQAPRQQDRGKESSRH